MRPRTSGAFTVDTVVTAETFTGVRLAGDKVVNAIEAGNATVPVAGTLSAALAGDEHLVVSLGGQDYTAAATGTSFSVDVATATASGSLSLQVVHAAGNKSVAA